MLEVDDALAGRRPLDAVDLDRAVHRHARRVLLAGLLRGGGDRVGVGVDRLLVGDRVPAADEQEAEQEQQEVVASPTRSTRPAARHAGDRVAKTTTARMIATPPICSSVGSLAEDHRRQRHRRHRLDEQQQRRQRRGQARQRDRDQQPADDLRREREQHEPAVLRPGRDEVDGAVAGADRRPPRPPPPRSRRTAARPGGRPSELCGAASSRKPE